MLPEILQRHTIRKFKPDPVEREKLERILEAGRLAPSAKNRQEWRFIVIQRQDKRDRIREAAFGQDHVGEAPVVVAACTTNIDYRMPNGQYSYPIDIACAVCFMLLQAVREGLGTCCLTTFDEQEVKDLLSVPYSMKVVELLLIGYADAEPEPTPRKPLRQIVSYNHW